MREPMLAGLVRPAGRRPKQLTPRTTTAASMEASMAREGLDMGDYQERYQDCDIEVAVEPALSRR